MNLHVFYKHISIMLLLQYTLGYLIPEASETDSESADSEVRHLGDDSESLHETNNEYKHLKSEKLGAHSRRSINEEKSSIKKECAVMYRDEEPVGILQPYKNSYQFFPIHIDEQIPVDISPYKDSGISVKRDTSSNTDEEEQEEPSETGEETLKKADNILKYADDRYPYIFAKFKVDSRIGKADGIKQRMVKKRESKGEPLLNEKNVDSLSSTLSRIRNNDKKAELVELRSILNDMGLIDDDSRVNKREAEAELNEDEDLEHGTNKINLIKLEDDNERKKREETDKHAEQKETATKHFETIDIPEPKAASEEEYIDDYLNKNVDQEGEHEQADQTDREKRSDKMAEQMEREIKAKLQKIKEEVRNEIDKIKSNNNNAEVDDDAEEKQPNERKKRNVINTLVESESDAIDPVLISENRLVPHIRRRRDILNEDIGANGDDDTAFALNDDQLVKLESVLESFSENKTGNNLIIDLNPEIKSENISSESNNPINQNDASTEEHFLMRNLKQYDELNTDNDHDADNVKENDKSFKFSLMEGDRLNREKKGCKCSNGEKNCKCEKCPNKLVKGSDGSNFVYIDDVPRAMSKDQEYNPKETIVKRKILSPIDTVNREAKRSPGNNRLNRKSRINLLKDGGYILDIAPDIYRITNENQETARKKRNSFDDLVAIHGGGPVLNHLIAIRERSMLPRLRTKRTAKAKYEKEQQLTLAAMSDEELFGALPRSFEGELARYKRVKRTV